MADTLSRIHGPVNVGSGSTTIFTGEAAHVYTIKQMTIVNTTGAAITILLGIGGVTAALTILPTSTIDAGGFAEWQGMRVLTGTQTLQATTSATGLTFTMDGLDQG